MNKPSESHDVLELVALVKAMIDYWKEIARRNFAKAYPEAKANEFERQWPKALANFFLAETIRVAKSLGKLSERRNN
jgi:hypothetical protein